MEGFGSGSIQIITDPDLGTPVYSILKSCLYRGTGISSVWTKLTLPTNKIMIILHIKNFKTDTTEKFAGSGSFFLTGQLMLAARLISEENFIWI
jgi:hypothetical protein